MFFLYFCHVFDVFNVFFNFNMNVFYNRPYIYDTTIVISKIPLSWIERVATAPCGILLKVCRI